VYLVHTPVYQMHTPLCRAYAPATHKEEEEEKRRILRSNYSFETSLKRKNKRASRCIGRLRRVSECAIILEEQKEKSIESTLPRKKQKNRCGKKRTKSLSKQSF